MTPDLIECTVCHTPNPVTATVCTRCATPITAADATLLGKELAGDAKLNEQSKEEVKGATQAGDSPKDQDATLSGDQNAGDMTDLSAQGWSRPVEAGGRSVLAGRLAPHRMLGRRYEIIQLLGEGGMGAVYKARDCELDRMVALKIIRPELAVHEQILARFKQELILARRITHKNVIRIFDLGEADGLKFITMEFVEGKDLVPSSRKKDG